MESATDGGEKPASAVISAPVEAHPIGEDGEGIEGGESTGANVAGGEGMRNRSARIEELEDDE